MKERKTKKELFTGAAVLFIYTAALSFVVCFHELWFDETQAWLIAKSASYKDILTYVPHYEGHPPLWHLILSVFAKNGAPVDLTLKALNIFFSTIAMSLLIFRSPFPKIVRYLLPFTYFFFYQYGIMSRPYSLTMIAVFLAAMTYNERNKKPWRYIMSLVLLCMTTAYGIILAGGLCIVWTFEIIAELIRNKKLSIFWKDKRFYSLCFILAAALALIIVIIPADDCFYGGVDNGSFLNSLKSIKSVYFIVLPFESWSGMLIGINGIKNIPALIVGEVIIGTAFWIALLALAAKNKKLLTFAVPYCMLCGSMSFWYCSAHHIGISALFHVFIFWIMYDEEHGMIIPDVFGKIKEKISSPFIKKLTMAVACGIGLVPIIYSGIASVNDITQNVGLSCLADTIKDNHLDGRKIMVRWKYIEDDSNKGGDNMSSVFSNLMQLLQIPSDHAPIKENRTYLCGDAAMILPYFDHNIFMNFNVDCPDDLYMHYKYKEDSEAVFEKVREKGLPDFIIGYCPIDEIYDSETLEGVKYLPIQLAEENTLYKSDARTAYERLYMREDLFDEYPQFKWIDDPKENHY